MQDQKFLNQTLQIQAKYDLHGIVNHYGTLGFGHYISFTKNPFDNKWYKYDDLNREEVPEEKLHKDSAYLLFYIRKDVVDKDILSVIPNIEKDYFPGKPIKTTADSDGFVLKKPPENNKEKSIEVKIKSELHETKIK